MLCNNQVIRELDRERTNLERQEKKLIGDIKKMAKSGQMEAVKIMAKDLVRTRNFVKKFILMRANIQAVSLKIQTLRSQSAMANALKGIKVHVVIVVTLISLGRCYQGITSNEQEIKSSSTTKDHDGV